jgi:hypothetical protein
VAHAPVALSCHVCEHLQLSGRWQGTPRQYCSDKSPTKVFLFLVSHCIFFFFFFFFFLNKSPTKYLFFLFFFSHSHKESDQVFIFSFSLSKNSLGSSNFLHLTFKKNER